MTLEASSQVTEGSTSLIPRLGTRLGKYCTCTNSALVQLQCADALSISLMLPVPDTCTFVAFIDYSPLKISSECALQPMDTSIDLKNFSKQLDICQQWYMELPAGLNTSLSSFNDLDCMHNCLVVSCNPKSTTPVHKPSVIASGPGLLIMGLHFSY